MKSDTRSVLGSSAPELPVQAANRQTIERAERLRTAAKKAGGNITVAKNSGVPLGTLNKYLAGGEMKLANVIALAQACGVSIEWLAHGKDTAEEPAEPEFAAVSKRANIRLISIVNTAKLASSIKAVTDEMARNGAHPPLEETLQAAILLYDMMTKDGVMPPDDNPELKDTNDTHK